MWTIAVSGGRLAGDHLGRSRYRRAANDVRRGGRLRRVSVAARNGRRRNDGGRERRQGTTVADAAGDGPDNGSAH